MSIAIPAEKLHMRLDGDSMVIGIKHVAKLIVISIIACCAVLVCTMFMNFYLDIQGISWEITPGQVQVFYDAQVSTAKVVCLVSGGCLLATSVVMLFFYIKHYIDVHKKELGILKALGYSDLKVAKNFWVFGLSVFFGAAAGFCGAYLIIPTFYRVQNEDHILPGITVHFHISLLLCLVVLPTVFFAVLSVFYACLKLRRPVLGLLREQEVYSAAKRKKKRRESNGTMPFLEEMRRNTLRSRKTLVFFIIFASFCYSSMTQMSLGMDDLGSVMMGIMTLIIGVILACTTLFLAVATVVNGNKKSIAMMRVFGYSQKECCNALLSGYRPMAYIGFAVGSVYQYALLKIMVTVVFKDMEGMPEYSFDVPGMLISLVSFLFLYEMVMYYCSQKIKKVSIKEIMSE